MIGRHVGVVVQFRLGAWGALAMTIFVAINEFGLMARLAEHGVSEAILGITLALSAGILLSLALGLVQRPDDVQAKLEAEEKLKNARARAAAPVFPIGNTAAAGPGRFRTLLRRRLAAARAWWTPGRRASLYVRRLHGRFGDWPLALAAYNAGEGRVSRLLARQNATTFAEIADNLPAETRMYVPKVLATIEVRAGITPGNLPAPRA